MFPKVVFSAYSHLMTHYMKRICYIASPGCIVLGSTRSAEWSSPKCKGHQASRKSLHWFPSIFLVKCLFCCFAHSCPKESWTGIFSEMEWEKQSKREICRKVLGRTLEATKSWIEVMSRNVWRYSLSPDGQLDFSHESNYFGRGRSSTKTFICHMALNRDSYSSGTKRHTLYAKVILSTENFVLSAHKILVSSNSFQHKVWNVLIWHAQSTCLAPIVAPSTYT